MSIQPIDKSQLKQILRTSQGFPTQWQTSKARVQYGRISPSRSGHAISSHVSGTSSVRYKTKFRRLDDMVDALWLVFQTHEGSQALEQLQPGSRKSVSVMIHSIYDVEAHVIGIGQVTYTTTDQRSAGISGTNCIAVLEGRPRAGTVHLHVQTFFPSLGENEIFRLLDIKTAP